MRRNVALYSRYEGTELRNPLLIMLHPSFITIVGLVLVHPYGSRRTLRAVLELVPGEVD